ncbi:hypothetical protein ACFLX7_02755 [Chloroflexota bacterium]
MKIKFLPVMVTISLATLLMSACTSSPGPTPDAETSDSDTVAARDTALAYLRKNESENAPGADIVWQKRNITPAGASGAGGETIEFTSEEWSITLSYPALPQGKTAYDVVITNRELAWSWTGTVEANGNITEFDPFKQPNKEKSRVIAEEFLRSSPTFVNSSMADIFMLVDTKTPFCAFCWIFVYEFGSRHTGYGDTSGQAAAQVITSHRAEIYMQEFKIKSAVMDDKWDMVEQQLIGEG